jgi:hypothetical protein
MCSTKTVKVYEERVPRFLLLVAVFEGFKGEVGCSPGIGGDEVFVIA